jgi:hypothetical protein
MERIAACPDFARQLAAAARARVEERFSATRLARDLEAEYEQLVQPAARPLALVSARSHS